MAPNPDEADELARDVFVKAYQGLPAFRRQASFLTWLFAISVNTALNHDMVSSVVDIRENGT